MPSHITKHISQEQDLLLQVEGEACTDSRGHQHAFSMGWRSHVNQKDKWDESQHAIIDNSKKVMYLNAAARSHAARRKVRGAYQGIISAQAVPGTVPRQCPVQCPVQCPLEKHNDLAILS